MYWAHLLAPPAFVVLSFLLSTVFGPWSVLPLLPFVLRFPNGDVLGWRRRIDPFVWAFLALAYVMYVLEWRAYVGASHAAGVGPSRERGDSPRCLCLRGFDPRKEPRYGDSQRPATLGISRTRNARFVSRLCDLFRTRRAVRRRPSNRLRRGADADLHRLRRLSAPGARRQFRPEPSVGVRRTLALRGRARLYSWTGSFARRRLRAPYDRYRVAGDYRGGLLLDRINRLVEAFVERSSFAGGEWPSAFAARGRGTSLRYRRRRDSRRPRTGAGRRARARRGRALPALRRRYAFRRRRDRAPHLDRAARIRHERPVGRMLLADEQIVWLGDLRSHLDPEDAAIYTSRFR